MFLLSGVSARTTLWRRNTWIAKLDSQSAARLGTDCICTGLTVACRPANLSVELGNAKDVFEEEGRDEWISIDKGELV